MKKYILTERSDLFEPNVYISLVVSLSGSVSIEKIKNAVMQAYKANEATMSKVVLQENGEAFYQKMDCSGCRVIIEHRDYGSIISESEKQPFAIKNGEMIRTYIIPEDTGFTLLIMAHHLVGDGQSILIFLQDMIDCLSGKTVDYKPMELVDPVRLVKKFHMPYYIRAFCKICNRKWKKQGRNFTWEDYETIHLRYWEKHHSELFIQTYSADEIKSMCPQGITVNSFMVTKLSALYPESASIGIPVSIREQSCSMSNQTSGIKIAFTYNKELSYEENVSEVHGKISQAIHNKFTKYMVLPFVAMIHPTLMDAVIMQAYGLYQNDLSERVGTASGYFGKNKRDLGITNLMKVNISCDCRDFQLADILFIPPKVAYSKAIIGIITYQDKMHVCWHRMIKD
ncbi:MAG TPA: condensation domain-containing protein [Lachnospiraceae bacterium]|nr:condensation domain-containing protein [Lachnospiraceae bacterium]